MRSSGHRPAIRVVTMNLLGRVEAGKLADLVIWQVPEHGMVINRFGTNLADVVIKSGSVASTGSRSPAGS
jgi:imidazolonepropionase-like amidohydrolase